MLKNVLWKIFDVSTPYWIGAKITMNTQNGNVCPTMPSELLNIS